MPAFFACSPLFAFMFASFYPFFPICLYSLQKYAVFDDLLHILYICYPMALDMVDIPCCMKNIRLESCCDADMARLFQRLPMLLFVSLVFRALLWLFLLLSLYILSFMPMWISPCLETQKPPRLAGATKVAYSGVSRTSSLAIAPPMVEIGGLAPVADGRISTLLHRRTMQTPVFTVCLLFLYYTSFLLFVSKQMPALPVTQIL